MQKSDKQESSTHIIYTIIFPQIINKRMKKTVLDLKGLNDYEIVKGNLPPLTLSYLYNEEEIDLCNSNIKIDQLHSLLKHAPYISKINISHCNNLKGQEDLSELPEGSLMNLREVNLSHTYTTIQTLQVLLKEAPQLQKISLLSSSRNLKATCKSLKQQYPSLKIIT